MANLVRLDDLSQIIARQLTNLSDSETVLKIQTKINDMKQNLTSLRDLVSAHEVERFFREVNQTMDWIEEEMKSLERDIHLSNQFRSKYLLKIELNARLEQLLSSKGTKNQDILCRLP